MHDKTEANRLFHNLIAPKEDEKVKKEEAKQASIAQLSQSLNWQDGVTEEDKHRLLTGFVEAHK